MTFLSIVQEIAIEPGSNINTLSATLFQQIAAGNSLVVAVSMPNTLTVSSITDNKSDTWGAVTGAAISDSNTGRGSDVWWVSSAAGGATTVTVTLSGSSNFWSFGVYEVSGISGSTPTASTLSNINVTNGSTFNGLSLSSGAATYAFYLQNLAGTNGHTCSAQFPWTVFRETTEANGGQGAAVLAAGGTQQAVFTPGPSGIYNGVISGVAFPTNNVPLPSSVPDCRTYGNFPNKPVIVQNTFVYTVPSVDSRTAGAPVDSRAAGAPVDSRVSSPKNSRTPKYVLDRGQDLSFVNND